MASESRFLSVSRISGTENYPRRVSITETDGPPTPAQMDATVRLCRWLMQRYGISLENVMGHCDCKATACPGRHFPWAELRQRLSTP